MSQLITLIEDFSPSNLISFLRNQINTFKPENDDFDHLFTDDIFDKYESIIKVGEAQINGDDLIVIVSKTTDPLTERSGKKKQYEIAKNVLKHEDKDAALFVFYDENGNFRFSFVKANYLGTKRDFTDFKRFTYFVTPNQTNKTFIKQIGGCSFNTLDDIKEAFSVEPLNKQFYQDIAKAFYELIGGKYRQGSRTIEVKDIQLKLPSTPIKGNRKVYQEFAVRLIGRTIFCWFLKNKKSDSSIPLVPESWLSSNKVKDAISTKYNYYHAVLEKLFFLVLNKKQNARVPYQLPSGHEIIPFLNGGLFEAHPDDFFPVNSQGIHQISHGLIIPNQWFIEFFQVLEQYNFTIDENSIYDAEVSIDPEMLGTIFENLLAEIDPDTEKSARKATGSFYTPREIVDYMVEQSLIQYLKTKTDIKHDEHLQELFKEGGKNNFNNKETKNILNALSDVKILDPACGSGAFPMGALHKIINALHKLDPDASWWKARQIENVTNALAKQMLKEKLDGESADYVRKLGIIQNSIYGVDIQPIASEISKLRSFLSLVIDETIDDEAENRGIQALPNLEFKFITANTLIGLDKGSTHQTLTIDFGETEILQDDLKEIRNQYLQAYGDEKIKLKKEFENTQTAILKNELKGDIKNKRAIQLASWKPFSNDSNTWFDPYWMYGVEQFDIVLGNPPYATVYDKIFKKEYASIYNVFKKNNDIYTAFYQKSIQLLKNNGIISLITPNTFLNGDYFKNLRKHISNSCKIVEIFDFKQSKVFQDPTVYVCIFLAQKSDSLKANYNTVLKVFKKDFIEYKEEFFEVEINRDSYLKPKNAIVEKIFKLNDGLKIDDEFFVKDVGFNYWTIGKGKKRDGNSIGDRILYSEKRIDTKDKSYLKGRDIEKYYYNPPNNFLRHNYNDFLVEGTDVFRYSENFLLKSPKLIYRQTSNKIIASLDFDKNLVDKTVHIIVPKKNEQIFDLKVLCGILNSKLFGYLYKYVSQETEGRAFAQVKTTYIKQLPIFKVDKKTEDKFINLVDSILKLKKSNGETNKLEREIDILTYKLYKISFDEIIQIDQDVNFNKVEYDNYSIN